MPLNNNLCTSSGPITDMLGEEQTVMLVNDDCDAATSAEYIGSCQRLVQHGQRFTEYVTDKLTYADPNLEAKLFPHLFPYGQGSCRKWAQMYSGELERDPFAKYVRNRLLSVDRRWALDE